MKGGRRMKKILFSLIFLTVLSCSDDNDSEISSNTKDIIKNVTDSVLTEYEIPGGLVLFTQNGESYLYSKGYADLDNEILMNRNLEFRIGSTTKTFVTAIVFQLVDEGLLSLEDNLSEYYPDITNSDIITLKQMCNHTSGIWDYIYNENFEDPYYENPETSSWTPEEILSYIKAGEPFCDPGEEFHYSNSNYYLLGLIIEEITGKSLEDVIEERIAEPLSFEQTYMPLDNGFRGEYIHGYNDYAGEGEIRDVSYQQPSAAWAAGAMISTIDELNKWVINYVSGSMYSAELHHEHISDLIQIDENVYIGMGLIKFRDFLGHNGEVLGYNTFMMYSLEHNASFTIFTNKNTYMKKNKSASDEIQFLLIEKIFYD